MDESLTPRHRVKDEGLLVVNFFCHMGDHMENKHLLTLWIFKNRCRVSIVILVEKTSLYAGTLCKQVNTNFYQRMKEVKILLETQKNKRFVWGLQNYQQATFLSNQKGCLRDYTRSSNRYNISIWMMI